MTKQSTLLYNAIIAVETKDECERFLYELLSEREFEGAVKRWQIVLRLSEEKPKSYRKVADELGISTTTISRVKRFFTGNLSKGGYRRILNKLRKQKTGE